MRNTGLLLLSFALVLSSCKDKNDTNTTSMSSELQHNQLLKPSDLPYFAPDFSKIKDEDFKPAIYEGIRLKKANIANIIEEKDAPTFENTIVAMERSGEVLSRVMNVFSALTSANTNELFQALEEELAPVLSEMSDDIYLNEQLFKRVSAVYSDKDQLKLDAESAKLLDEYYKDFIIAGANLSNDNKSKLKDINSQLASLTTKFGKVLLDATNDGALIVKDKNELKGLGEEDLSALKTDDGTYKIPLQNTTQQPLLSSMADRATRKELFEKSWLRADGSKNDTKSILLSIAKLRVQKAQLLGFKTYADWSLQKSMIKNKENIRRFFDDLIPAAVNKAQNESDLIEAMMHKQGVKGQLEPWDWSYYGEMVRKEKYDLNEEEIKPYFELKTVLEDGVFYAATKLYGITFKKRTDIPVYNKDVVVYELFEEDGSPLGLFYGDFFARSNKRGGAWMSNFVEQSELFGTKPVIYNVCNYSKPADGKPALITFDDVETMFHEFGHALHGFFANQKYPSLSGTNVARDFVEFPSQFNENWSTYPEILNNYAKHYKTGEVIPASLLKKIKDAATFNQGYSFTELLGAANLDYAWHTITVDTPIDDVNAFESASIKSFGLDKVNAVKTRYRSTYFAHVFGGGYAAGYYAYLWTEMLDHDAYQWFVENGGLTRANGQRFRDMILSRGNTNNYDEMYKTWRGKEPSVKPLIIARGLN